MKMQKLVAIRHCDDDEDMDVLTPKGVEQAKRLVMILETLMPDVSSTIVLSSNAGRSIHTAKTIAHELGRDNIETARIYALGYDDYRDGERQIAAIEKYFAKFSNVIVVTHDTAPSGIVNAFRLKHFDHGVPAQRLGKGQGFIVDCQNGQVAILASTVPQGE